MRLVLEGTPTDIASEREVLKAQFDELLSGESISKSLAVVKPSHVRALNDMRDTWLDAYQSAMSNLNDDILAKLRGWLEAGEDPR